MNLVLEEVRPPRKAWDHGEFLTVPQYHTLARRLIGRFAPQGFKAGMLKDEDAIGYVAYKLMKGDWAYDPSRDVRITTWRGHCGRRAIQRYVRKSREALGDGPLVVELDEECGRRVVGRRPASLDEQGCDICKPESDRPLDDGHERLLLGLLAGLPRLQRRYVRLHVMESIPIERIAAEANVSRQSVHQAIERALRTLRRDAGVRAVE